MNSAASLASSSTRQRLCCHCRNCSAHQTATATNAQNATAACTAPTNVQRRIQPTKAHTNATHMSNVLVCSHMQFLTLLPLRASTQPSALPVQGKEAITIQVCKRLPSGLKHTIPFPFDQVLHCAITSTTLLSMVKNVFDFVFTVRVCLRAEHRLTVSSNTTAAIIPKSCLQLRHVKNVMNFPLRRYFKPKRNIANSCEHPERAYELCSKFAGQPRSQLQVFTGQPCKLAHFYANVTSSLVGLNRHVLRSTTDSISNKLDSLLHPSYPLSDCWYRAVSHVTHSMLKRQSWLSSIHHKSRCEASRSTLS